MEEGRLVIPEPTLLASAAQTLGIQFDELVLSEGSDELFISTDDGVLTGADFTGLGDPARSADLVRLGEQLGGVGYIAIKVGELVESGIGDLPHPPQWSLQDFVHRLPAQHDSHFRVEIRVSKAAILERMARRRDEVSRRLFLFGAALSRLLDSGLAATEVLWQGPDRYAIVALGDVDIDADGPLLRVVGGRHVNDEALMHTFDAIEVERMRRRRDEWVAWDKPWTDFLTPLHFQLRFRDGIDSEVGIRLTTQPTKCGVLFTCDRARRSRIDANLIRADYRGASHAATVAIHETGPIEALSQEQVDGLCGLIEWVYRPPAEPGGRDWFQDRLQFAQILVARNLELFQTDEERLNAFVRNTSGLAPSLEQQWITFTEGKINDYVTTVVELEREVGDVQHEYVERSGAVVKSLGDTMLAAVAVLVGSFIGAAFEDPFNAALFRIGVGVYAGYVVVFPAAFGLTNHWIRFDTVRAHFHDRVATFRLLLGQPAVTAALGSRPGKAERRFKVTFGFVVAAYVAAVALATMAVIQVPGWVGT